MKKEQQMKAEARLSAQAAKKPDPAVGKAAIADAEAFANRRKQPAQPIYATQTKPCGTVVHRGSGVPMSEFSDPCGNTVRASKGKKG